MARVVLFINKFWSLHIKIQELKLFCYLSSLSLILSIILSLETSFFTNMHALTTLKKRISLGWAKFHTFRRHLCTRATHAAVWFD